MSSEARELELVNKLELRIALTLSEVKLQTLLNKFLPPLLLKLESEHQRVRNKVVQVCQHINTRIEPESIQLPVGALLEQLKQTENPLLRQFDLIYIQRGLQRLSKGEKEALFPDLIRGLHGEYASSPRTASKLFYFVILVVQDLELPKRGSPEDQGYKDRLKLVENEEDLRFLSKWIGKLLLFSLDRSDPASRGGLSDDDVQFLSFYNQEGAWLDPSSDATSGLVLSRVKNAMTRLLASGLFNDETRHLPALIASSDSDTKISDLGDDMLKRTTFPTEDEATVQTLLTLFLGQSEGNRVPPVRVSLRIKILSLLSKSQTMSEQGTSVLKLVQIVFGNDPGSLAAESGLMKTRLESHIFSFLQSMARLASKTSAEQFAGKTIELLIRHVELQGFPQPRSEITLPLITSRTSAYETIGSVARTSPSSICEAGLGLLRWLFLALAKDSTSKETSNGIDSALSLCMHAFEGQVDTDIVTEFESLLKENALRPTSSDTADRIVRHPIYIVTRFANRCLPYHNATARLIDLLAISHQGHRNEIMDEGRKGLDPTWHQTFENLSQWATQQSVVLPKSIKLCELIFDGEIKINSTARTEAVSYILTLLFHEVLAKSAIPPTIDSNWRQQVLTRVKNDEDSRQALKTAFSRSIDQNQDSMEDIESSDAENPLKTLDFLLLAFNDAIKDTSLENPLSDVLELLEILVSLLSRETLTQHGSWPEVLRPLLSSSKKTTRLSVAHIFGLLLVAQPPESAISKVLVDDLLKTCQSWETAVGQESNTVHASISVLGIFYSRANAIMSLSDRQGQSEQFQSLLKAVLLKGRDKDVLEAAAYARGQLNLYASLNRSGSAPEKVDSELVDKLLERSKAGNDISVMSLAFLALRQRIPEEIDLETKDDGLMQLITGLFALHETRQPELHFTVGAALSCVCSAWQSSSLVSYRDVGYFDYASHGNDEQQASRDKLAEAIMDSVLARTKTSKPSLKQAAAIWLLCLIEFHGTHSSVANRLYECQNVFKMLLSDRDTLNQETASRGLALLYDRGDAATRADLVKDLVNSFTGTQSRLAGTVSDDTQLFEEGSLPTGEGSVTTYKDVVSLANEVGDPSLIYRFMDMAANSSIWSSRAAFGRFGLNRLLSDANASGLMQANAKLYPALYRYRFDPNSNVRTAMNEIWSTLVKNSSQTIDEHFDAILQDLLKNILAKEWRTRQASCAAIADLVQGRPITRYQSDLTNIWTLTFKVCDDIKASVREAAMQLARVLTGILTRALESGAGAQSSATNSMLQEVLPFLLSSSGLESSAAEVQAFALGTLVKIIKVGDAHSLGRFLPDLISRLLALLSSLEPESINYLHLNADKYGITSQQLDDARLSSVKRSPMMDTIERCLDLLNESTMSELQKPLENTLKTVIGLPSRVGVCRVLISLSTRHNQLFRKYAGQFLRLLQGKYLLDRNDTIAVSAAAACGYMCRISLDKHMLSLIESMKTSYIASEDDRHRQIAGEVCLALGQYANDRFKDLQSAVIPLVFLGKHDLNLDVAKTFEKCWDENVGGSLTVSLYAEEILSILKSCLDSPRWNIQHAAAFALVTMVKAVGKEINEATAKLLWPVIQQGLSGKTWEGKEKLIVAMVEFLTNLRSETSKTEFREMAIKIMVRESKRQNAVYRKEVFASLGSFADVYPSENFFEIFYEILLPAVEESCKGEDAMELDAPIRATRENQLSTRTATIANGSNALFGLISRSTNDVSALQSQLSRTSKLLSGALSSKDRRVLRPSLMQGTISLIERLLATDVVQSQLEEFILTLFDLQDMPEPVRSSAASCLLKVCDPKYYRDRPDFCTRLSQKLTSDIANERSSSIRKTLTEAKDKLGK